MEKYSSYKDSGFEWMGQIPSHWESRRFRYLLAENSVQNTDLKERKQLQFKYGDIVPKADQSEDREVLDTIQKYTVVAPGDIMINGLNLNYDFISQRVAQVQESGVITSAYVSLRPLDGVNSKYYTYYMKAMDAKKLFHGMGSGVRLTLSYDNLKNLLFPYPSPQEQEAIVEYLDAVTSRIDEAISQQQSMISLLNERKKIVINHAVTKGLNPNVIFKETGISWIGVIPEHWRLMQLRHTVTNHDYLRQPITADQRERTNPQYDYYGASGVIDKIDHYNVDDKVLLIGEDGGNLVLRNLPLVYKAEGKFWVNNHAHILKPKGNDYDFMAFVLEAADYTLFITGSAQPKLSQANLNAVKLPIPPIEEQREIVAGIKPQLEQIDKFIEQHQSLVSLLNERKQIIINDVVTGKVKVV